MPAYGTVPVPALYIGDKYVLSSASIPGLKSQAVYLAANPDGSPIPMTIDNGSATTLTVQYATVDADANYVALSINGTAATVAATTAETYQVGPGFYRFLAAADPGATTITLQR